MPDLQKLKLFALGADALSRISPYRDLYACPSCKRLLPVTALDTGELTLEHVPPDSVGGKGIALTCKSCNSTAGHTVDAAIHGRKRLTDLAQGLSGRPAEFDGPVKLETGGITTNAKLSVRGRSFTFSVDERQNHPSNFKSQMSSLPQQPGSTSPGVELRVTARIPFDFDHARVGDLRSAFLATFALFGYRYAMHPRLEKVREQILRPDQRLIEGFSYIAVPELTEDPMIVVLTKPFEAVQGRISSVEDIRLDVPSVMESKMRAIDAIQAAVWLLVLTLVPSCAARAQDDQANVAQEQIKHFCERAKHDKTTATDKQQKITNIVALQDCGDEGVGLLSDYWSQPGSDPEVSAALASVSSRLNDRRLYQAARSVLLDSGKPESVRLDALSVMVSGYDPTLAVAFPAPTKPMQSTYVSLGHTSHANQKEGRQPVRGYAREDLPKVLARLANSDQNERVRKVAGELGPLIARRDSTLRATKPK